MFKVNNKDSLVSLVLVSLLLTLNIFVDFEHVIAGREALQTLH